MIISRLTATAALFAVLATTTLALAAPSSKSTSARAVPVVQFETVVVVGHRIAADTQR